MTDKTKNLFDAPWERTHVEMEGDSLPAVTTRKLSTVSVSFSETDANRLARLPELYDKLMWAVVQKCPDAFFALDECRLCVDKKCEYREIIELLKKVRDGE